MIEFKPEKLTFQNVDRYYIKKSIFQYLISKSLEFSGNVLDVGCGEMPYKDEILKNQKITNYTGLDIYDALEYKKNVKPDYYWDGVRMPFEDETFDSGFATEVLEHCPDPFLTLKEMNRVLRPNSPIILTVPFLWPTHESPHDYFRYTPFALKKILEQSGFEKIEITCLGGWDASLAQLLGLWIKRRGFSIRVQRVLFAFFKPVILVLLKKDKPKYSKSDQNMFTNLGVIAWKK